MVSTSVLRLTAFDCDKSPLIDADRDPVRIADALRGSPHIVGARAEAWLGPRHVHHAGVWAPLGYTSWQAYCAADFGIGRAQAYRLLDVARTLGAIHGAVAARHREASRPPLSRRPRPGGPRRQAVLRPPRRDPARQQRLEHRHRTPPTPQCRGRCPGRLPWATFDGTRWTADQRSPAT